MDGQALGRFDEALGDSLGVEDRPEGPIPVLGQVVLADPEVAGCVHFDRGEGGKCLGHREGIHGGVVSIRHHGSRFRERVGFPVALDIGLRGTSHVVFAPHDARQGSVVAVGPEFVPVGGCQHHEISPRRPAQGLLQRRVVQSHAGAVAEVVLEVPEDLGTGMAAERRRTRTVVRQQSKFQVAAAHALLGQQRWAVIDPSAGQYGASRDCVAAS